MRSGGWILIGFFLLILYSVIHATYTHDPNFSVSAGTYFALALFLVPGVLLIWFGNKRAKAQALASAGTVKQARPQVVMKDGKIDTNAPSNLRGCYWTLFLVIVILNLIGTFLFKDKGWTALIIWVPALVVLSLFMYYFLKTARLLGYGVPALVIIGILLLVPFAGVVTLLIVDHDLQKRMREAPEQ